MNPIMVLSSSIEGLVHFLYARGIAVPRSQKREQSPVATSFESMYGG